MFIDIVYASSEATEVAVEAAPEGVLGSLGINAPLFIFQLVNFAIVAAILWFLILKPITKKMSERQRIIDEGLENAKEATESLKKSEADYKMAIDAAKNEANKILERASVEAGKTGEELKNKAKKEIEALLVQAKNNIRLEKQEMESGMKKYAADLVAVALQKILEEKMTSEKDRAMIEKTLKEII